MPFHEDDAIEFVARWTDYATSYQQRADAEPRPDQRKMLQETAERFTRLASQMQDMMANETITYSHESKPLRMYELREILGLMPTHKTCPVCCTKRVLSAYSRDVESADGTKEVCRQCTQELNKLKLTGKPPKKPRVARARSARSSPMMHDQPFAAPDEPALHDPAHVIHGHDAASDS